MHHMSWHKDCLQRGRDCEDELRTRLDVRGFGGGTGPTSTLTSDQVARTRVARDSSALVLLADLELLHGELEVGQRALRKLLVQRSGGAPGGSPPLPVGLPWLRLDPGFVAEAQVVQAGCFLRHFD